MKRIVLVLVLSCFCLAKDTVQVQVVAVHPVTHEDQRFASTAMKVMTGAHSPSRQMESFNLDAVVGGQHVVLTCEDPKGCESLAIGTYDGEVKRNKWIKVSSTLPVSEKKVTACIASLVAGENFAGAGEIP